MSKVSYRWSMTAAGEPMAKSAFDPSAPGEGEVIVEVAGCGVCHTDLGYYYDGVRFNHPMPLTLGHEISGRVVAASQGVEGWLGKAVLIPAVIPCGVCDLCVSGHGTICRQQRMPGNDIQGGFATHITVPVRGLCPVDEKKLAAAGFELADISVVADAVTTPYQAVVQAEVQQGDLAIVIGVGGVGSYAVQIAKAFGATVVAITSDAAVEPYPGWGAYGGSKAALEHTFAIWAQERPDLRLLVVDPGDMRTRMHQDAFPGEDISDRPLPEERVPGLLALLDGDQPSGRYRVSDLLVGA